MNQQSSHYFAKLLLQILRNITDRLSEIPLLVVAIGILILVAAAIGGTNLVIEVRIFLGVLAFLGVIAILTLRYMSIKNNKTSKLGSKGDEYMSDEQYQFQSLLKKLETLNKLQFEEVVVALLSPQEQNYLSQPLTRASFLNDMRRWGKLDEVEYYLYQKFPER